MPSSALDIQFLAVYTVDIPGDISDEELASVGAGIWLDFQINFENWQLDLGGPFAFHSSFETSDIPSTYLGYVAEVKGLSYEQIITELGGGVSAADYPSGHPSGVGGKGLIGCWVMRACDPAGHRNDTIFLKTKTDSGYNTLSYPDSLYIAPADDWSNYVIDKSFDTGWPWEDQ